MKNRQNPLPLALLAQVAAALSLSLAVWLFPSAGESLASPASLPLLFFLQGALAAIIGAGLGLRRWWLIFQLLLPLALALALRIEAPSWVYLLVFLALLLVYWNSFGERVPLYLTSREACAALALLLPKKDDLSIIDLGCGLGGVLAHLAPLSPKARFEGVESAPALFAVSFLRLKFFGQDNARIIFKSFWKMNLADYDVVYCFLSPAPMAKLYAKARAEMRKDSLFISNSFEVPCVEADEIITVKDRRQTSLRLWRM